MAITWADLKFAGAHAQKTADRVLILSELHAVGQMTSCCAVDAVGCGCAFAFVCELWTFPELGKPSSL